MGIDIRVYRKGIGNLTDIKLILYSNIYGVGGCPYYHAHKMAASVMRSVFRRDLFNGKVAVVTGGATGLGRAITEELTSLGCKVVIASRKLENLEETAKTINETLSPPLRSRVFPYQCNIRNEEQARNY